MAKGERPPPENFPTSSSALLRGIGALVVGLAIICGYLYFTAPDTPSIEPRAAEGVKKPLQIDSTDFPPAERPDPHMQEILTD